MLNPESVDLSKDGTASIEFTDSDAKQALIINLEVKDARRLAQMILKNTAWSKTDNKPTRVIGFSR